MPIVVTAHAVIVEAPRWGAWAPSGWRPSDVSGWAPSGWRPSDVSGWAPSGWRPSDVSVET